MRKGKDDMANKSMKKLRGKKDVSEELAVIKVPGLRDIYLTDTIFRGKIKLDVPLISRKIKRVKENVFNINAFLF